MSTPLPPKAREPLRADRLVSLRASVDRARAVLDTYVDYLGLGGALPKLIMEERAASDALVIELSLARRSAFKPIPLPPKQEGPRGAPGPTPLLLRPQPQPPPPRPPPPRTQEERDEELL